MEASSRRVLLIGVVFHLLYAASIFDIYFRSPIVHGMTPVQPVGPAPARRLVLFVADGLRADRMFELDEEGNTRAPFLRSIIETTGRWGVLHTRVPTESRPGHVALIAGLYEDVSAVTKGWQENPVEFDSVFNESRHTWSFGSPDILPMFAKGATPEGHVETLSYDAHAEDFGADSTQLDHWVFEHVTDLFERARTTPELDEALRQDRIVLFCHLLGLDTVGHSLRPHSAEYKHNIAVVDRGIRGVVQILEDFYDHDGQTAYIFTSDHGMNDRGAHGDGDPQNTEVPLVAWGAGIRKPTVTVPLQPEQVDPQSKAWGLDKYERVDVNQADVAPLMASLIGVPPPMNNVGVLPLDYLQPDLQFHAQALATNARQIYAQYARKAELKKESHLFFAPFPELDEQHAATELTALNTALAGGQYSVALQIANDLIALSLRGLHYYQTYDWAFLRSIVSAGYLGWIAYTLAFMVRSFTVWGNDGVLLTRVPASGRTPPPVPSRSPWIAAVALGAVAAVYLAVTAAPPLYYVYIAFPIFFWAAIFAEAHVWWTPLRQHARRGGLARIAGASTIFVAGMEVLVATYFERRLLTAMFYALAVWPLVWPKELRRQRPYLWAAWSAACCLTAQFTLLPVVSDEQTHLVLWGALTLVLATLLLYTTHRRWTGWATGKAAVRDPAIDGVIAVQCALVAVATWAVYDTTAKLERRQGLPLFNQAMAWLTMGVSLLVPFVGPAARANSAADRLAIVALGFGAPMVLLSISYEVLFYVCFAAVLFLWLVVEWHLAAYSAWAPLADGVMQAPSHAQRRQLQLSDVRIGYFFLFFINVAYFGTGNVASVASFSVASVYRLITVFSPFLMGALLIVKITLPFFFLAAIFGILTRLVGLPPSCLFVLVVSAVDIMTLNFFFLVRDTGSWLEIGASISHFIIASGFIVFLTGLFYLSHLLVGAAVEVPNALALYKKRQM